MKILISTDIEGVAGVFAAEQVRAGNPEYERARRWMTAEANAAIEGAFAGGAQAVWVNDSHGGFRNLLPDALDARARVILGKPRVLGMMAGLEARPDLVFMIGYHAKSQTRGVLAHTINSSAFTQVWLNGVEVGEAGLYGALAREHGAHVALASGDDVFAQETRPLFPDAHFETVKTAGGASTGDTLTPAAACARILAAARETVERAWAAGMRAESHRPAPATCTLRVQTAAFADLFAVLPTLERVDAVTLRFGGESVEYVVRTLNSLSAMSFMLR
ncbi:M55 family metallopeptidase [Burkholderia guangdongensis]|uniref:M55 family metallopeptidase n=1 Tax=Burkholderia guangdongensis TaxID=1792500 RepID=UPI0015CA0924|nr:M55 family metallopeptidase [Burkholderia guangdongensis]